MKLIIGIIFCIALTAHGASIRGASGAAAVDCSKFVDGKVPESCKKSEAAASGATGIPEPTWGPKKVLKTTKRHLQNTLEMIKINQKTLPYLNGL